MKIFIAIGLIILMGGFSEYGMAKATDAGQQVNQQKQVTIKDKALKNYTNLGDWRAWGNVYNQKKQGQAGLIVELYDKDLMFDDLLGKTKTDSSGKFIIQYQERDFKELTENKPDLYLVVKDKKNKPLYSSKKQPRYGAGKTERFTIVLKTKLTLKLKILKIKK